LNVLEALLAVPLGNVGYLFSLDGRRLILS
jgi:hypothetical protein